MPILIGLHAPMCGGKTTVAKLMLKYLDAEIISIATPLKEVALGMGWNGEKDEKGRRLLQLLGTECGRKCIAPDIWIKKWHEKAMASKKQFVIADDLRWPPSEAKLIDDDGYLYRIVGREKPLTMWQRIKKFFGLSYCHYSELPIPDGDGLMLFNIDNTGTLEDLEREVQVVCAKLIHDHSVSKKRDDNALMMSTPAVSKPAVHIPSAIPVEPDVYGTRACDRVHEYEPADCEATPHCDALVKMLIAGAAASIRAQLDVLVQQAVTDARCKLQFAMHAQSSLMNSNTIMSAMAAIYLAGVDPKDENAVNHACFPDIFPLNEKP